MIAAGVAKPIAHGHATINTAAAMMNPAPGPVGGCVGHSCGSSDENIFNINSCSNVHASPANNAITTTTGTNTLLTRSPMRWMSARLFCARSTAAMMCASAVLSPVAVTRTVRRPLMFAVPAKTFAPGSFSTGNDSPVSIASFTAEFPSTTTPSVGT